MARDITGQSKAVPAASLLALALGAAAFGAVAIGALEVDELTVRKLRVLEHEASSPRGRSDVRENA